MNTENLKFGIETYNWYVPRNLGGVEKSTYRLANFLSADGNEVRVFTGANFMDFQDGKEKITQTEGKIGRFEVNYHMDMNGIVSSIEELVKNGELDILEIQGFFGIGQDAQIMKRILNLNIPLVWVSVNAYLVEKRERYSDDGFNFPEKFVEKVDAIICKSKVLAEHAREFGFPEEKIHVIYNPIDTENYHAVDAKTKRDLRTELGLPQDKKVVLYLGRVAADKGSDFWIDNWEELVRQHPEYHLAICGDVAPGDALQGKFEDFKKRTVSGGTASFSEGFVSNEVLLAKYYQTSDIFFLASPTEGLSSSLLEAMACELPCVVSQNAQEFSGVNDLIIPGFNGATFKSYTVEGLVEALNSTNSEMGKNGHFKFQSMGVGIKEIFAQRKKLYKDLVMGKKYSVAMVTK